MQVTSKPALGKRVRYYHSQLDMICHELPEISLNDGSHTIILSTHGENDADVPEELVKFLKFVGAGLEER